MRSLLALSCAIDALSRVVGRTVSWLILVVVVISATNAVSRKAFHISSNAWLEVQWYLFGAIFLLAAGYTLLHNEHVRVDVLATKFTERTQVKIEIFGVLLFLLPICAFIFWMAIPMFVDSYVTGEMSSNSGGLIRWPVKLMVPVGFGLLLLAGVSHLIKCIGFLKGLCPNPLQKLQTKSSEELLAEEIARQAAIQAEANTKKGS
ncbi:MAG TPA: TRAP transporter small permease subunit [Pusillimonas sp.]|uniref:TRAP transporter small permease subunit n=1 Tax=Pusillimonas sp. TaxID=3040095 RepID=UPI002C2FE309|nr:TRAP transporter small permease subunit [Pusillimonas sp.]HUH88220.1 TRAP transporter small permease subunit [Pusillimonas sp.]